VDRPDNNTRTTDANKKALNMVLCMALVLVVTVSICVVIWRLASDHGFDTLGRYIATAGIVYISIGMMVIADRAQIKNRTKLSEGEKVRKLAGDAGKETRLMLFLCGIGLLCLFIGTMIILSL
jgi:hypothetical protein